MNRQKMERGKTVKINGNCAPTENNKHSSNMKEQRLEILRKVANGELTPEQAYTELLGLSIVSGSLPMYDVEELNEIVKQLNSKEISLYNFVGKVWNKAYILGCIDGSKGNDR